MSLGLIIKKAFLMLSLFLPIFDKSVEITEKYPNSNESASLSSPKHMQII